MLSASGFTFRTAYLPIDRATCDFFVQAYEKIEKLPEVERTDNKDPATSPTQFDLLFSTLKSEPLVELFLQKLQAVMDQCMQDFGCPKVFVKGSSRSAKDAVNLTEQFREDFESRCASLKEKSKLDANTALIAMLGAGKDSMASASAEYFLRLFLRSQRIYQDLTLAVSQVEESKGKKPFLHGFAIREWVDIDIGMEFRAFVHNKQLNAMCQYDYLVNVPELLEESHCQEISQKLQTYWETKIQPALDQDSTANKKNKDCTTTTAASSGNDAVAPPRFHSYVVDFALDVTGKPWVIELNPYQESTDGAMFSWSQERTLLDQGPFEFRIQTQPQNGEVCLSRSWRSMYREMLNNCTD